MSILIKMWFENLYVSYIYLKYWVYKVKDLSVQYIYQPYNTCIDNFSKINHYYSFPKL